MTVASLTKFTVPVSSDQSPTSQGILMPKLKYKFRAMFENFGVSTPRTELTKQVMNFTRPSVSFNEVPIEIYNSRVYLAGKYEWSPITVELRDDINGSVTKLVGEQIQKQFDFLEQASAVAGIDYKFVTRFEVLDGGNGAVTPNVLETWEMYGCYISESNYNDANYQSDEPMTISLTLRFDNAVQTPIGDGIGASVLRTVGSAITG
tara:strand:- start:1108 stop:1725 length:618 start_codon:yes stop_codon:yes gene_type:complete